MAVGCLWSSARAQEASPADIEFFETRIRPVLVEHCYECHNSSDTAEGGLAVDYRQGLRAGGDTGQLIVAGEPDKSRLLPILKHEIDGLEMPEGGPQLSPQVIADFEEWIARQAPDPRDAPPSADEVAAATAWPAQLERRKQWWSFQPIRPVQPPPVSDSDWSPHPIDRFIASQWQEVGLEASPPADPAILVRRLHFAVTGLPPTSQAAREWTQRLQTASAKERVAITNALIDNLLSSPRYGERWARHWMDWIRYAESHGSEGDPLNDNAWAYRDYLIRALNADVPYDQLLREHVAGDLLDQPRINERLGINESAIGPAHWRMVFHGFAPTDAMDEKVRFTDDQINAFSKAFLGLTVSCARCHNHKFDAISQTDYYAMFGILGSCRPGRQVIDSLERQNVNCAELQALKPQIRTALANDWLATTDQIPSRLHARLPTDDADEQSETEARHRRKPQQSPQTDSELLHPVRELQQQLAQGRDFATVWQEYVSTYQQQSKRWQDQQQTSAPQRWHLRDSEHYADWFANGSGLPEKPSPAGEFSVAAADPLQAVTGIYPAGVYSHALTAKHPARLTSPSIPIDRESELWVQVRGDADASLRYAVQNYPRNGTVYPVTRLSNAWSWQRYDLSYWQGEELHVELATAKDAPLLVNDQPRSWFGVRAAMVVAKGAATPGEFRESLFPIIDVSLSSPPSSMDALLERYQSAITSALQAWKSGEVSDAQALLLDACLREGLLSNTLSELPTAQPLLAKYQQLEAEIPVPIRVPGLDETQGRDQPLLVRGDHKQPGELVPRRFLEAIDATPYDTPFSGRRQLAEDLLREDNPFTRRVIVNRIWHHLFGRGIVATPDNFGRLGSQPTHPELLDWLAHRFEDEGWSLKRLIREILTSQTWQLSSQPTQAARALDPDNRWLSHAHVQRLEAEAIRDLLLSVSGRLEQRQPDAAAILAPVNGDGNQRSVYVRVVRNSLDPFLRALTFQNRLARSVDATLPMCRLNPWPC